jgi:3-dehydroquinate synthase
MQRLEARSEHGDYPVVVDNGALIRFGEVLRREGLDFPTSVVTDETVGPLHARAAAHTLGAPTIELPGGEPHKTWTEVEELCRRWLDLGLSRSSSVLAIGGGIVTDTVGFAAAVFLRGIDWVAAPTTLLAMVDAAVGGKTGVNLTAGKNLVGCFWPPRAVLVDVNTLATLPGRELRAGMVEVLKAAWIGDHGLLERLASVEDWGYGSLEPRAWEELVARSVAIKIEIVTADEHETGRRKALNLGHTLGHALEAATGYRRFLHGEAVAWGLEAAAILGRRRGLLTEGAERELRSAVDRLGPRPAIADLDADEVCGFIAVDKKRDAEGVGWVLPTDDGVVLDQRVDTAEAVEVLRQLQRESE